MSQGQNNSGVSLSGLLRMYMERASIKSRTLELKAGELTGHKAFLPRSTIENWRREGSKRISNWEQAIALTFLLRLNRDEAVAFLRAAQQESLQNLYAQYPNNKLWQQLERYAQTHFEYQPILDAWWGQPLTLWDRLTSYVSKLPLTRATVIRFLVGLGILFGTVWLARIGYMFVITKPHYATSKLEHHTDDVHRIAWNPMTNTLVSAGEDEWLIYWDIENEAPQLVLAEHAQRIRALAWCADGRKVASGDDAHVIKLWDSSGQLLQEFIADGIVRGVDWNSDCSQIVVGTERGTVTIFDLDTQESLFVLTDHQTWVRDVAWSPDDLTIATVDKNDTLIIWDSQSGQQVKKLAGYAEADVEWSLDGTHVAATDTSRGIVIIWDTVSNVPQQTISNAHDKQITDVSWHPNGQWIVTSSKDMTSKIWRVADGTLVATLIGHKATVWEASWSADGSTIASADAGGVILLWDTPLQAE